MAVVRETIAETSQQHVDESVAHRVIADKGKDLFELIGY
jgi:hypothetical protein